MQSCVSAQLYRYFQKNHVRSGSEVGSKRTIYLENEQYTWMRTKVLPSTVLSSLDKRGRRRKHNVCGICPSPPHLPTSLPPPRRWADATVLSSLDKRGPRRLLTREGHTDSGSFITHIIQSMHNYCFLMKYYHNPEDILPYHIQRAMIQNPAKIHRCAFSCALPLYLKLLIDA